MYDGARGVTRDGTLKVILSRPTMILGLFGVGVCMYVCITYVWQSSVSVPLHSFFFCAHAHVFPTTFHTFRLWCHFWNSVNFFPWPKMPQSMCKMIRCKLHTIQSRRFMKRYYKSAIFLSINIKVRFEK